MNAIIFDIDGTLANVEHRRHFVQGPKKDFDAFYEAMVHDTIVVPVRDLLNMYIYRGWHVALCTGRPRAYYLETQRWLADNLVQYDELLMRPNSRRFDPDYQVKRDMLDQLRRAGHTPMIAVDDRDQVVRMWRDEGLTCFQVADGDF